MKPNIHPKYFTQANVTCACGNNFTIASAKPQIFVEVCYKCHPLFTGEERLVDIKGQVDKFKQRQEFAKKYAVSHPKKEVKLKERLSSKSLKDLLAEA